MQQSLAKAIVSIGLWAIETLQAIFVIAATRLTTQQLSDNS
jgi:hypothetical protein